MIKLVTLLSKKPGMSREAFIAHYETHHRLIGEKYLKGYAAKYQRRYLLAPEPEESASVDLPFDVLMEIWFPDQPRMEAAMAIITSDAAQEEIVADEERLFDRALIRSYVVEEHESEMPEPGPLSSA